MEEGNYSLLETREKLGSGGSLHRHTSLAFSAIYTEVFFFFSYNSINVCTVSLGYFYFVGEKRDLTALGIGFETEPLLNTILTDFITRNVFFFHFLGLKV